MEKQTEKPAISVVMPVYNAGKHLRQSMDSVLSQTFEDFEFIIVDCGSDDESVSIVESYSDSRIRPVLHADSLAGALNTGISQAKGNYIARMDACGTMVPDRLAIQYEFMETHFLTDVSTGWIQFDGNAETVEKCPSGHSEIACSLAYGNSSTCSTIMFGRTLFNRKKLKYKNYPFAEDYKMMTDMIGKGFRFAGIPQTLGIYRRDEMPFNRPEETEIQQTVLKIRLNYINQVMELIVKKDERYLNLMSSLIETANNDLISIKNLTDFIGNIYAGFLRTEELRTKHAYIMDILKKKYAHIIRKYRDSNAADNIFFIERTSPVWVCWWQGEANMPDIVKICYRSICRKAGSHPVKLVTKENYAEYVRLPDGVIEKVNSGVITVTHFSDILRMNLLYEYGGYWIDATVLLTGTLREDKSVEFFTVRTVPDLTYVADGKWTIFLTGGGKHGLLFDFTRAFLHEYWKKENKLMDYFLTDYITALAYENIPAIKKMIDRNDCYMPSIFDAATILNKPFDAGTFNNICRKTNFHKLSWKYSYTTVTESGEPTLYGYLLKSEYIGLEYSDIGRILFYCHHARSTGNKKYLKRADDLPEKFFHDLEPEDHTADRIYRAGSSVIYLLRNNFVEGNEDDILSEIDGKAFHDIYYRTKDSKTDWYGLLHYLKLRISADSDKTDNCILLKNRQLVCEAMDAAGRENPDDLFSDKRFIDDMEDLYQAGFAKGLIRNILDGKRRDRIRLRQIKENAVTFVIPVRLDSPERKRNLHLLIEHLKQIPDASAIILEADSQSRFEHAGDNFISSYFVEDHDPIFYLTKYRNMLLSLAKTTIAGIWDTDVIVPLPQILKSVSDIQNGCMISYPYDGRFLTLSPDTSEQYRNHRSVSFLMENIEKFPQGFGTCSVGGAFLVNKDEYLKFGGENEHIYGWGVEDLERVKRMEILGFDVPRTEGPLFHLFHPRTSWFDNKNTETANRTEFVKICSMTEQELRDYVKIWRCSKFQY
ncbi:MAG: glycosyltransferase [Tannerella sp.]|jgi:glycosyltransferase involved in cell wall biosynthesis|nr:glycosyltransferase [Tannerella sp.]